MCVRAHIYLALLSINICGLEHMWWINNWVICAFFRKPFTDVTLQNAPHKITSHAMRIIALGNQPTRLLFSFSSKCVICKICFHVSYVLFISFINPNVTCLLHINSHKSSKLYRLLWNSWFSLKSRHNLVELFCDFWLFLFLWKSEWIKSNVFQVLAICFIPLGLEFLFCENEPISTSLPAVIILINIWCCWHWCRYW